MITKETAGPLLLELRDEDIGLKSITTVYIQRRAVRCVLRRGNKIALLHVRKHAYHKLPGGGIEEGETAESALCREVAEEIGSQIEVGKVLGHIIEYKSRSGENQICTCYLATEKSKGKAHLTEEEIKDRFKVEWYSLKKAIGLLRNENHSDYFGKFIIQRELRFLQEATKHKDFFNT